MSKKELKKMPEFKTDEEFGRFVLDHDMTEYLDFSKAKRMRFSNLKRSGHVVPIPIPDDDYERLSKIASDEKKPIAELIRLVFQRGLKDLAAHRTP
jgi:hypothetical protein